MVYIKRTVLLIMCINLLVGCSQYTDNNITEEIAPVIFWAIDDGGDGKIKISTVVPPLLKENKHLLTQKVYLFKQGGKDFNLKSFQESKSGQLRMLLLNEDFAKKGIISLLNTMVADPETSPRLYLVIIKGNLDEYLNNQISKQPNIDYVLYRMLKHYEKYNQGEMSIVNLHQVMKRLNSPLPWPALPVFKVNEKEFIYEGTAFFNHDKLVMSVNKMKDQIFQLLNNDYYLKLLTMPKVLTTMGHVRSKVNMKLNQDFSSVSIKVNLDGRIKEYRGDKNLFHPDELEALRNEIESYLENQTTELLKKWQQYEVDPLQIGNLTRTPFSKQTTEQEWLHHWKKMKIHIDYQINFEPLMNIKG